MHGIRRLQHCPSSEEYFSHEPPLRQKTNAASTPLATYQVGESLTVTALYINTVNEYWYRIQIGEQTGYIPANAVEYKKHLTDDFSFTDATIPNAPVVGKSFNMKGVISAKYNAMTSISANILSGFGANGTSITGHKESVNTSVYSLYRSNVDSKTKFGTVPAGKHTYQNSVEYQNWYIDKNGEMAANTGALTILEHYFVAVSKSVAQSSCKHSLSNTLLQSGSCTVDKVNVQSCATCGMVDVQTTKAPGHQYNITTQSPTCTESGQTIKVCKICGNKQQETLSQTGHSWSEAKVPGSCISHPCTEYTCDNRGDSYRVYSESLMSNWVESVTQGFPQDMVQEKTQYRFARPTTFQSYELLADEILLSSAWDAGKTISLEYVATWPSGFCKGSDLYQQYNNSPVTSLESDTLRREIHSDKQIGYLYYHWCYNDRYTTFHAYFTETDPSNFDCDTSDGSYNAKHETCANTNWYYVTPVNMQEYTEYQMLYTYRTWEDWSEWSDELPDGDNIKIESRTVYRYVDAAYEPHSYENGVCTVCGANEPIESPTITLQYPTLLLEDEIKMNVFFTLDQNIPLENMGMLTWTSKPDVVDIATAENIYPGATFNDGNGFYGVNTDGIPAQNLGDTIYFCINAELADGSIVYGKQVQYSPVTYAYNQLKGGATTEMKSLLVAILNYGAAAQTYLEDTDPLVNANLTDDMKALVEAYRSDMVHSVAMPSASKQGAMAANGGFSAKKPSISLDGAFSINYYFTPSATVKDNMTFYYWNAADFAAVDVLSIDNATGSMVMSNDDGVYGAAIEGIAAKDIDGALYACGVYTDVDGNTYSTGILPYSLGFYCGNTAKGEGTLADLAAAIAVYGYYASSYFAR